MEAHNRKPARVVCSECGGLGFVIGERDTGWRSGVVSTARRCQCFVTERVAVPVEAFDTQEVVTILSKLACLNFFPADDGGRVGIVAEVLRMASNIEQVRRLVDEMLRLYNNWPGPAEMRVCFCCLVGRPRDGVEMNVSEVFAQGIVPGVQITSAAKLRLSGPRVSSDKLLGETVSDAAETLATLPAPPPAPSPVAVKVERMSIEDRAMWDARIAEVKARRLSLPWVGRNEPAKEPAD